MIDHNLEELLEVAASSVTVPPTPTDEVLNAARKGRTRRGWTVVALSSVAAATLVVGVASLTAWQDNGIVVEQAPLEPARIDGTRLVGIGQVFVAVPADWGTNQTQCGTPMKDTVVLDVGAVEACLMPRPADVDSVTLIGGKPLRFHTDQSLQIDGVDAEASFVTCREQYGRDYEICSRSVYFPEQDVAIIAESSSAAKGFLTEFLKTVHVYTDAVAVPGFMTVNGGAQEKAGGRYIQLLERAGLQAEVRYVSDTDWPDGFVTDVGPTVGALVHPGDSIEVSIAGSPAQEQTKASDQGGYLLTPDGRTYGDLPTDGENLPVSELPDLIGVRGDNGVHGYITRRAFMGGPAPASPKEALEEQQDRQPVTVPVFAEDGVTIIDTFTIH